MVKKLLSILILLSCIFFGLSAQNRNFKHFSVEDGLPQSSIYAILQDSRGLLWLGTENGISCFDGLKFKNYNKKNGLVGNFVRTIIQGPDGNIWIGTDECLCTFDGFTFKKIELLENKASIQIFTLYKTHDNSIWVGAAGNGAFKIITLPNKKFKVLNISKKNKIEEKPIFSIVEDSYKNIWLGSYGYGLYLIDGKTDSVKAHIEKPLCYSNHILSADTAANGDILFGTYDVGYFSISKNYLSKLIFSINKPKINSPDNTIWDITTTRNGQVWMATNSCGIVKIGNNKILNISRKNGLPGDQIYKIYEDLEQNIWIGTMNNGLIRLIGNQFSHFTPDDNISNNVVSIVSDNKNNMWMATSNMGLAKVSHNNDKLIVKYFNTSNGLPENNITSVAIDKNHQIWLGTSQNGICSFNGNNFKYYSTTDGLINNEVRYVFVDSKNLLWIGTIGGVSIYNGHQFFNITEKEYGFPTNEVTAINEDKLGQIWIGTLGGLAKYYKNKMVTFDEEEGLTEKKINTIAISENGCVWIGTFGGGLFVYDPSIKGKTKIKPVQVGSDIINSLYFLSRNQLIVATDKGLDKLLITGHTTITHTSHFDKTNGFTGIESNPNAISKDADGNVWIGTVMGVTCYKPYNDKILNTRPKIHITGIRLNFELIKPDSSQMPPESWYPVPQKLDLAHNQNRITFDFVGIYLTNPEKVKYRYVLDGNMKEWSPFSSEHQAVFSSLPPGKYHFKVQARNDSGVLSEIAEYPFFIINPPFWQTWWFIISCIIIFAFGIILFIRFRENKLRKDKAILEKTVVERTAEISEQKHILEEQQKEIGDSIEYASLIQNAVLPEDGALKKLFKRHFILFRPRDKVSGDFFWINEKEDCIIIAVADCTGHGVPGALMSMLGVSLMNEIVNEKNITSPAQILNQLRQNVIRSLRQNTETKLKDGMDISVVAINKQAHTLTYAAANNNIYLRTREALLDLKAERKPVAIYDDMSDFNEFVIPLSGKGLLVLSTDGYRDQFGGLSDKKFSSGKFKELIERLYSDNSLDFSNHLDNVIVNWMSNSSQTDDITVIGIEYNFE